VILCTAPAPAAIDLRVRELINQAARLAEWRPPHDEEQIPALTAGHARKLNDGFFSTRHRYQPSSHMTSDQHLP
jgi:hypothetical protein